ncbi:MAG: hypothetical protein JST85_01005 [Acidobacteria bacterium]|nr:hypothetical protein [Acidobacteriota bacterium]
MSKLTNNVIRALFGASLFFSAQVFAQTSGTEHTQKQSEQNGNNVVTVTDATPKSAEPVNVMRSYHGIQLGMSQDEVHKAAGKPDRQEKTWDEFKLEKEDLMTVRYDNGKVNVIQLYFTDAERAPEFAEVVGDAELNEKPNGAKFARRAIAAENFWVSMYQSADKKVTTVTIGR